MKKWGGQLDIRPPHSKNWGGRVPPIPPQDWRPCVKHPLHSKTLMATQSRKFQSYYTNNVFAPFSKTHIAGAFLLLIQIMIVQIQITQIFNKNGTQW